MATAILQLIIEHIPTLAPAQNWHGIRPRQLECTCQVTSPTKTNPGTIEVLQIMDLITGEQVTDPAEYPSGEAIRMAGYYLDWVIAEDIFTYTEN